MATLNLQPQRVPFGGVALPDGKPVQIAGQNVVVFISREWYRKLEQIAAAAGGGGGNVEQPDDGLDPYAGFVWQGSEGADAGLADGAGMSAVPAVLLEHEQGLQALAADALVFTLLAKIAALEERIDALEQGTP